MSTREQRVLKIVRDQLGVSENEGSLDSNLIDDFGADSLDHIEIVMALEEDFEIQIADEEAEKLLTARDALNLINRKCPE